jgi:BlaI family penicillinase repressor
MSTKNSKPLRLGRIQMDIMGILWLNGEATAREITDALSVARPIAHSTVQTLLRQLESKGAVSHEARDRTFAFRALIAREDVASETAKDLLSRLFGGSAFGLVSHLLEHEEISDEELERLRELIEARGAKRDDR